MTYFLVGDNENVIALADDDGEITDRYEYSTFGELESHTGSDPNRILFSGEPNDQDSGLVYLRHRYYEPGTGKFVTKDLNNFLFTNRYTYCGNNPIGRVDPTGLDYLEFNGYAINWFDGKGKLQDSFQAFSGNYDEYIKSANAFFISGQFRYGTGPIVEGIYWMDPLQIEEYGKNYSNNPSGWGPLRVPLNPDLITKINIKCHSRSGGFYIHGGKSKGTQGCIEIAEYSLEQPELKRFFKKLKAYGKKIQVNVNYGNKPPFMSTLIL